MIRHQAVGHRVPKVLLTLTAIAFSALTWAGTPSFSGPSITKPATPAQFQGLGFAPNAALTVLVKAPGGATSGFGAVAGPNGDFSYTLVAAQTGAYTVTVTDSGGRPLATATVAVLP